MGETARQNLPEPNPTKESLAEFTAVAQSLFDDLYEFVKTFTGDYNEEEISTENVWLEDAPIFRKVWVGNTSSGTSTTVPAGVAIDTLISCRIRLKDSNDNWVGSDSNDTTLSILFDSVNNFQISHNLASLQTRQYYIIAEYTKSE